uniref:PawS-like protein (-)alb.a n=1 Tax=Coreopsis tinctoria TaxID=41554 RepID=A0A1V0JB83_CORTI|nr:PawS-like protein (-)alb.a [Coreopsis tinctoria]
MKLLVVAVLALAATLAFARVPPYKTIVTTITIDNSDMSPPWFPDGLKDNPKGSAHANHDWWAGVSGGLENNPKGSVDANDWYRGRPDGLEYNLKGLSGANAFYPWQPEGLKDNPKGLADM